MNSSNTKPQAPPPPYCADAGVNDPKDDDRARELPDPEHNAAKPQRRPKENVMAGIHNKTGRKHGYWPVGTSAKPNMPTTLYDIISPRGHTA